MEFRILALLLVAGVGTSLGQQLGNQCEFTEDCKNHEECRSLADASCVCNFGYCNITGGYFFRTPDFKPECETYKDCPCSRTKESCFCKDGNCQSNFWECRETNDCNKLAKCKDKACTCRDNTCEFECETTEDCIGKDKSCENFLGYKCKCENSLCESERKPEECGGEFDIRTCVEKGLCVANQPCACTQSFCTKPWWVRDDKPELNCRNSQECIDTILECDDPDVDCPCDDFVKISDYEEMGTCKITRIEREPEPPCEFSPECRSLQRCATLADAGCVCNFGVCNITGGYFFRTPDFKPECKSYKDCPCSKDKENCFCQDGFCRAEKWECHDSSDCKKLSKCKGKDCTCSGNTCEFECNTTEDCKGKSCETYLGFKCKCENSLCAAESKPTECGDEYDIDTCVSKGLCEADKPCACTQSYCTKPWWVSDEKPELNCRTSQDCIDTIVDCGHPDVDCPCDDLVKITDYAEKGTCKIVPIEREPEPPCTFSPECRSLQRCASLADASCVCNFGHCNVTGGFFFRSPDFKPECETYNDCPCSNDRDNCFCRNGFCKAEKWECQDASDCRKYDKCSPEKPCACSGNTCEWECNTDSDCADQDCNKQSGYRCECQASLCEYKRI